MNADFGFFSMMLSRFYYGNFTQKSDGFELASTITLVLFSDCIKLSKYWISVLISFRVHSFSKSAKFSENLLFLLPCTCKKCQFFSKFWVRTKWMITKTWRKKEKDVLLDFLCSDTPLHHNVKSVFVLVLLSILCLTCQ